VYGRERTLATIFPPKKAPHSNKPPRRQERQEKTEKRINKEWQRRDRRVWVFGFSARSFLGVLGVLAV
jgi:hypothetical protein